MKKLNSFLIIILLHLNVMNLNAQKEIIIDNETVKIDILNIGNQTSLELSGGNPPFGDVFFSLISSGVSKMNGSISDFDGGYLYMRDANDRTTMELFGDRLPGTDPGENYAQLRLVGDSDATFFPSPQTGPFIPLIRLENDIENNTWELGLQGHVRGLFPDYIAESELVFRYSFGEVANIDENGNYNMISDKAKKYDIKQLTPVLRKVMQLNPVTYCFKGQNTTCDNIGFIAQEVDHQFSSLVRRRTSGEASYLMMNYSGLIPIAVKAIQEQQVLIEEQEQQLQQQGVMIKELFKRIEDLESEH